MMLLNTHTKKILSLRIILPCEGELLKWKVTWRICLRKTMGLQLGNVGKPRRRWGKAWCSVRWEIGPHDSSLPSLHSQRWWWAHCCYSRDTNKEGEGDFVTVKMLSSPCRLILNVGLTYDCITTCKNENSEKRPTGYCQPIKNNVEKLFYLLVSFCEKKVMIGRKTKFNKKLKFYLLCCIPLTM